MEDFDEYVQIGPIDTPCDMVMFQAISDRPGDRNVCKLYLHTLGGDPDVAYRMMRALHHAYDKVIVVLWGDCKSAGTLMTLGADELVMFGEAELGPLDIQLPMKNELLERRSGNDPGVAFRALLNWSLDAYRRVFMELKLGANMSTQLAADAAARLVVGLHSPIYGQIDPLHVASIVRKNLIGADYGWRLISGDHGITDEETLDRLIIDYPSHGFVIDRDEAKELFPGRVRHPIDLERTRVEGFRHFIDQRVTMRISEVGHGQTHDGAPDDKSSDGASAGPPDPGDDAPQVVGEGPPDRPAHPPRPRGREGESGDGEAESEEVEVPEGRRGTESASTPEGDGQSASSGTSSE